MDTQLTKSLKAYMNSDPSTLEQGLLISSAERTEDGKLIIKRGIKEFNGLIYKTEQLENEMRECTFKP